MGEACVLLFVLLNVFVSHRNNLQVVTHNGHGKKEQGLDH
jgi:hypothetical protein